MDENQGAVECISGRVGSAVDSCEMKLRDGTTYCYGPPAACGAIVAARPLLKKVHTCFLKNHLLPATLEKHDVEVPGLKEILENVLAFHFNIHQVSLSQLQEKLVVT